MSIDERHWLPGNLATEEQAISLVESLGRTPMSLSVVGSHLWGLANPKSDLDIRGVYIEDTEEVLSLSHPSDTIEKHNQLLGNVDFQIYEVAKALRMILSNNGNLVEFAFAPTNFYHLGGYWQAFQALAKRAVTKQLAPYYRGYFYSQRKKSMKDRGGKALVYTFREAYAGIHLMRTGDIIYDFFDLRRNVEGKGGIQASRLLDWALENRFVPLSDEKIRQFEVEWEYLMTVFNVEIEKSLLPDLPDDNMKRDANRLLLEIREDFWRKGH